MDDLEKITKEKKFEFIVGCVLLFPSLLIALLWAYVIICDIYPTDYKWFDYAESTNIFLFLGIIAAVGVYLTKDKLRYFIKDKNEDSILKS